MLEVRDVAVAEPGPGQVRVRMIASLVHPSDLLLVRGQCGTLPPGFEGVGVGEKPGGGLPTGLVVGPVSVASGYFEVRLAT